MKKLKIVEGMNRSAQTAPAAAAGAAGVAESILEDAWRHIEGVAGAPFEQVQKGVELGAYEREQDVATSGAGMDDETYRHLIGAFTRRGLGTTPEVIQSVSDFAKTMPLDWANPMIVQTMYGIVDQSLMTGGVTAAARTMGLMTEFTQEAAKSPYFNIGEMLEILNAWMTKRGDPREISSRINSLLSGASMDPNDPRAMLGMDRQAAEGRMRMGKLFRQLLAETTERPDAMQRYTALSERNLSQLRQNMYKSWMGVQRGIQPGVWGGVNSMSQGYDYFGRQLANPRSPWSQGMDIFGNPLAQVSTMAYTGWAPVGPQGYGLYDPRIMGALGQQRAASTENKKKLVKVGEKRKKLKRVAQIPPGAGADAWQMDVMNGVLQGGANSDALVYMMGSILGPEEKSRKAEIENEVMRLERHVNQFYQQVQSGGTEGVANLDIIQQVEGMTQHLVGRYDQLLSLYDFLAQMIARIRDSAYQSIEGQMGQQQAMQHSAVLGSTTALSALMQEKEEVIYKRDFWARRGRVEPYRLSQQARETMVTDPLRKDVAMMEAATGGHVGTKTSLSAALAAEAAELEGAIKALEGVDPARADMLRGQLESQKKQKMLESIENLVGGAKSALPTGERAQILGI